MNTGGIVGCIAWSLCGLLFIIIGIYNFFAKTARPLSFWANGETISVDAEKVKPYNRALGKLWIGTGIFFILIGLPLLSAEQNSPWVILSILGAMAEVIVVMVIYVLAIEKKYRKR